jgi:hypothetical protein
VEQIHDAVDEGTGLSYPFTVLKIDGFNPNFGTEADLVKKTCSRNKNRP